VLACLEKHPDQRPASALACIAALDACEDVLAWTDEQASAWWSSEGAGLLARPSDAREEPSTTEATILRPGAVTLSPTPPSPAAPGRETARRRAGSPR
jgi:hypothetical protein